MDVESKYFKYLQLLSDVDPGAYSEGRWWDMLDGLLTRIVHDILPGNATFSLHEIEGDHVIYRHGGPEGRRYLRETDPTPLQLGRIGSAIRSHNPYEITSDLTKLKEGVDYIKRRQDALSELVAPIRGPQLEPLGVVNIETDKKNAFDDVDGSAFACLAAWIGTSVALARNVTGAEINALTYLRDQLDGVRSVTTDEAKHNLLFEKSLMLMRTLVLFQAAGVVTAVASGGQPLQLSIKYLDSMHLPPERAIEFSTRTDTLSYHLIRECLRRPREIILLEYDVDNPGSHMFPVREFRSKTRFTIGIGLTYHANERKPLAITLDFDQRLSLTQELKNALRSGAWCLRSLLSLVEEERLARKRKILSEGHIIQSSDVRHPARTHHYEFGQRAMEELREAISASGCGIFFAQKARGEFLLDSHVYEGIGANVYWSMEFTREFHQFQPALEHNAEIEYIHTAPDGGRFIVFAKGIRLFRNGIFISLKDVTDRPDLWGVSTTTKEIVRDFLPVIESASRERQVHGELQWVNNALAVSLEKLFETLNGREAIIRAVHSFLERWEPVSNPYCAFFEVLFDDQGRPLGLKMADASYEYIKLKTPKVRWKKVHDKPIFFDFEKHGDSLTVQSWSRGELFGESVEGGADHCTEWWDGITGMRPEDRMFAGSAIVSSSPKMRGEKVGVLTLNGPRNQLALRYPENIRSILSLVKTIAASFGKVVGDLDE